MSLTAEFLCSTHMLRQEEDAARTLSSASRISAYPTLESVLTKFTPLPANGLFMGVASDGLPVLLNMADPRPGALLVLGDGRSGKTDFLQGVARAASLTHHPRCLRFAVVTSHPEEWEGWSGQPHCFGVWTPETPGLKDILVDLSTGPQQGSPSESLLFLVDNLQCITDLPIDIQEKIYWLLANGASNRLWTFASLEADLAGSLPLWVKAFGTRIYGRVGDPGVAERLTSMPGANLRTLLNGAQFCIRERNHWLRFWLPLSK